MTKRTTGHITLVQEDRFRLTTSEGQALLLTLAHNASLQEKDLLDCYKKGANVIVEYEGEAGTESGTARDVKVLD